MSIVIEDAPEHQEPNGREPVIDFDYVSAQVDLAVVQDNVDAAPALAKLFARLTGLEETWLSFLLFQHFKRRSPRGWFNKQVRDHRKRLQESEAPKLSDRFGPWADRLSMSRNGLPYRVSSNAVVALTGSNDWQDVIACNEFREEFVKLKPPPFEHALASTGPWTERDDIATMLWLQNHRILVKLQETREAVAHIAELNRFHPVRSFLNACRQKWDGQARINNWFSTYLGAPTTHFNRLIGWKFLVGAVARVKEPGCKADAMPVFEGKQGSGKSSALNQMFGDEWFTDHLPDLRDKDAPAALRGVWCVEFGDLARMRQADAGMVKNFVARKFDNYRPAYGHYKQEFARQCVFSATTNEKNYLVDSTGGRRFWPVLTTRIDLEAIARDRVQLWGEAVAWYEEGKSWNLDNETDRAAAAIEQAARYEGDVWDAVVFPWLAVQERRHLLKEGSDAQTQQRPIVPYGVTSMEILVGCLQKRPDACTPMDHQRITRMLTHEGWSLARECRETEEGQRYAVAVFRKGA